MNIPFRAKKAFVLANDFLKKCDEDHVAAFGAMSAFFMLLSLFPFMIFLLTLTKYAPFTKDDIIRILNDMLTFEQNNMVTGLVNEIYRKTGASIFTISIIAVLWSSSRGVYSIVKGLNSVYDIDDNRNYFVLRLFSVFCTVIFAALIIAMLILWVFGNTLYHYICEKFPVLRTLAESFLHRRIFLTVIVLTLLFIIMYKFIPGRGVRFRRQWPGALAAALGWMATSAGCSFYVQNFNNFSYVYGSMAGIMILLLWLYFCMSMIFYGAEINFYLENRKHYHRLVNSLYVRRRRMRREWKNRMKEQKTFR